MNEVYKLFDDIYISDKSHIFNTEMVELLELKNLLDNAIVTMHAADFRKESRGAHSHDDFTERDDDNWLVHTITKLSGNAENPVKLSTRDVIRTVLTGEVSPVPLAKRVY